MQRQRRKLTVEDGVVIELRRKTAGRASDRAGAWPVAQRDQRGARARHGRLLRRRAGTGRGGSAVGDVGQSLRSPLFAEVAKLLRLQPQQIAGRRKRLEDGTEVLSGLRVKAIYQAIYAVPRGELRRELLACQGKPRAVQGWRTAGPDLRHHPRTPSGGGGCLVIGRAI